MGGSSSKPAEAAAVIGTSPDEPPRPKMIFDWGEAPDGPPEDENDIMDMVLVSWGNCRSKPSPTGLYRSDEDEKRRRDNISWRKRTSFIELNCGEDAFFVSNNHKTIGVADGVGGWRDEGVDASAFSNVLMQFSKLYSETHRKILNPETILQNAFDRVKGEELVTAGSSTALVASIITERDTRTKLPKYFLDIANIGDSGCMVVRNKKMIFRAREKVHGFNAPYQLSVLPPHLAKKAYSDNVCDCVRERVEVKPGDVVVVATDGLFDNRFNSEIVENVGWIGDVSANTWDEIPIIGAMIETLVGSSWKIDYQDPYRVAQREITLAHKASMLKEGFTPWSSMLRKFGVDTAKGGKVDDITMVLSRVCTRDEAKRATLW